MFGQTWAHARALLWAAPLGAVLLGCGGGGDGGGGGSDTVVVTPVPVSNTASYQQFVNTRASTITSLSEDRDFADLQPIGAAIGQRRIVQLGESSHGSGSMNKVKTRLIKYLHQQQGFNVIAFESSTFGCNLSLEAQSALTPSALMASCVFGVWHTREVEALFSYIKQTQLSDRPLRLSGFDVQVSSANETAATLRVFFESHLDALQAQPRDAVIAAAVEANRSQGDGRLCFTGADAACQRIRDAYASRVSALDTAISIAQAQSGKPGALAGLVLLSLRHALDMNFADANKTSRMFETRDLGMARVLTGLAERLFPEDKIMVWAHNAHIAEDYPQESLRNANEAVMGMHLHQRWGDQLYTIGLYMVGGQQADNNRAVTAVTPHKPDSLESLFAPLPHVASFLPLPKQDLAEPGDDWLHGLSIHKFWGRYEYRARLAQAYDALLVIRESQAPVYIGGN
ncbi:erythromycin esterase family protein [Paucibacter sp. XJ19-41]|uniref:erythromycin esterase family protein n=1 Tax=Paucibacter sp. XJ19-41 TaxID=2927824 RepID=UPI00234AE46B|nr:erythromycin esterase family protein [Paucibacter sp. XJ19-41]MDC6166807.1 erythromycin esterase family protein [Paucibacter sp. XJ19-41]